MTTARVVARSAATARKGTTRSSKSRDGGRRNDEGAEEELELLPLDEAERQGRLPPLEADPDLDREGQVVLLSAVGEQLAAGAVGEGIAPVDARQSLVELAGRHAGGVEATDDRSHAGAGDGVDRDPGASSSTLRTPTCEAPRAPPPERTRPMRGRAASSAAADGGGAESPLGCAEALPGEKRRASRVVEQMAERILRMVSSSSFGGRPRRVVTEPRKRGLRHGRTGVREQS